jgi:hypothetical protein
MSVRLLIVGICSIYYLTGNAQSPSPTPGDYLRTAVQDQSLERFQAQMTFLTSNNYNLSWLNRLEFRIGSEDANLSMNEYRLRVSPSNPWQMKANKNFHTIQKASLDSDHKVAVSQALKTRYDLISVHWLNSESLALLNSKQQLISDYLLGLYQPSSEMLEAREIMKYEELLTKIMMDKKELELKLAELEYVIALDLPGSSSFDWNNLELVQVEQVFARMSATKNVNTSLYLQSEEAKLRMDKQLYQIEKTESRRNIGYIQSNFESDKGKELEDKIGFQIGIRIPITNPDKPDLRREQYDLIKKDHQVKEVKTMLTRQQELMDLELNHLYNKIQIIDERLLRSKGMVDLANYKSDLLKMHLDLAFYQLDLKEIKLKTTFDVYKLYFEYLDLNGVLVGSPIINYLSVNLDQIYTD